MPHAQTGQPPWSAMVWWRFKKHAPGPWVFGYVSDAGGGLVRMGAWNGDTTNGHVVNPDEIEWMRKDR